MSTNDLALPRRRRNSLLAAIEKLRQLCGHTSLSDVVAFLYVCENEGVNVRELAQLAGMTNSKASRTARRLSRRDAPNSLWPYVGVVELRGSPHDGRSRTLHLTPLGSELRDTLESLIAEARPIRLVDRAAQLRST